MTEEDFSMWLYESKVANSLGHYNPNGLLHTAVTSREELRELVRLAYESGVASRVPGNWREVYKYYNI